MTNGEKIGLFQAIDAADEARHIVEMIKKFHEEHSNISLSQIAILYRTNAQCKSFIFSISFIKKNLYFFK